MTTLTHSGRSISLALAVSLILVGCGGKVGEVFSLTMSLPDEFAVVKRTPLSVPPDFALRPPPETLRDSKVAITDTRAEARALIDATTEGEASPAALSEDDFALLDAAGGEQAMADIRRVVDQESTDLIRQDRTFIKEILSFIIDPDPPGTVLDPNTAQRQVNTETLVNIPDSDPNIIAPQAFDPATITPFTTPGVSIVRKEASAFDWGALWPF